MLDRVSPALTVYCAGAWCAAAGCSEIVTAIAALASPANWDNEHVGVPPKVCPTKVPAACCNTWPGPPQLARVILAKATSCLRWMKAQLDVTGVSPLARSRLGPFSAHHSVS